LFFFKEFDPQPIRVDKVNIGILSPINPVSNSENRRRFKHCTAQRDRADLKKLHYDGARMYQRKINKQINEKFYFILLSSTSN
jgi:hypothetical protein